MRYGVRDALRCLLICGLACWAASAAWAGDALRYELTPAFGEGRLHVDITWETGDRKLSALRVSESVGIIANVPGLLKNVASNPPYRQEGGIWIFKHRPGETIRMSYDVVTGRGGFDKWEEMHYPITGREYFCGLGNTFLMVPNSGDGVPSDFEVVIRWKLPAGFKAACSWGVGRHIGRRISASNLRHSFYVAGRLETAKRENDGRKISVAMVDRFKFSVEELADAADAIIAGQCAFMGEEHFPEFVVTAVPVGPALNPGESRVAGSGLFNSFVLFVAPRAPLDDAVEHLFAHELFHHWNGKMLPAAEPERQVWWFTEGFTDYYALRILYETGRWDAPTYVRWINKHVREYYLNPARNVTNETIERDYWNERRTVGEVPYQRGLLLAMRWNALARKAGVREGVDKLMLALVNRARAGTYAVSNPILREAGKKLLGEWFAGEFDRYVLRAQTIELPPHALGEGFVGKMKEVAAFELGFDRDTSLRSREVHGLVQGSEAAKAGLREGDRLTGWEISGDAEKLTKIQVERGGKRGVISYYPRGRKEMVMQFEAPE